MRLNRLLLGVRQVAIQRRTEKSTVGCLQQIGRETAQKHLRESLLLWQNNGGDCLILTVQNYFSPDANCEYMSVSQFKSFRKCQAAAMAELNGQYQREQTTALLVGSYVDAWFSGEIGQFRMEHPEIFKRDGTLKTDYEQAERIIARVQRDPMFMELMLNLL